MSKWEVKKLGEVCSSVMYGYTESASKENIGPKFLRITDIVPEHINWGTVPYCKISDSQLKKYKLYEGDIVIARTGATTGFNKMISKDMNAVFASYLIRFRVNQEQYSAKFISYCLKTTAYKGFIDNYISGAAQPGINATVLSKFRFSTPDLPTQKRIADILSAYDDLIENNNRRIAILEKSAQELYKEWFVRFRFPNYEKTKFVNGLPEGWEVKKLKEVITIKYGKDHKMLDNGNIPIYGSGGIMRYGNKELYSKESVLIPRKGTLNNIMLVNEPFWTIDTMFYTELKQKYTAKYLFYVMNQLDMTALNPGAALPSMTTDILYHLKVVIPCQEILKTFDEKIDVFFYKVQNLKKQNSNLTKQRDLLLPRLLSGKLEV